VRVDAQFDPRFAGALQPPYPAAEQRNAREGEVRVRVTIAPDGRVAAVEKVSATSDAFWQVTQRQALSRWRFKPATVDGKPVQSSKVLSVFFKLDGQ
jgi:protein TonB